MICIHSFLSTGQTPNDWINEDDEIRLPNIFFRRMERQSDKMIRIQFLELLFTGGSCDTMINPSKYHFLDSCTFRPARLIAPVFCFAANTARPTPPRSAYNMEIGYVGRPMSNDLAKMTETRSVGKFEQNRQRGEKLGCVSPMGRECHGCGKEVIEEVAGLAQRAGAPRTITIRYILGSEWES